jgi:nucleotide-binding universal stress UspA family protein
MEAILCAVDFSPATALAVGIAKDLAAASGARLAAFHAVHFASDPLYATDLFERRDRSRRLAEAAHRRLAQCLAPGDLDWEPIVARGDPVEQLSRLTRTRRFDLVVTVSRGIGPLERFFVGTVVERMVQRIACPILILRAPPAGVPAGARPLSRILVGCDLHQPAAPLETACRLGRYWGATDMHLLHVSESPLDQELRVSREQGPAAQNGQVLRQKLEQRLSRACPEARAAGIRFHLDIRPGVPAEVLRDCARECRIDLLVVGVHRTGAIKRALIGSTARDLLHHAPCSLLTVPQPDDTPGDRP